MYYSSTGQEIEDAEMDAMREDARELTCTEMRAVHVTGEMIHDAYKYVISEAQPWTHLSHEQAQNYLLMAEHLNRAIDLKVVGQEPGYVWSNEETES